MVPDSSHVVALPVLFGVDKKYIYVCFFLGQSFLRIFIALFCLHCHHVI